MTDPVITKEMCIGAVMKKWPETIDVFRSWFGKGCFTCPGSMREDIEFGANMHNVKYEAVLKELNAALEKSRAAKDK
ncbi:MAG: hypothetical protein A3J24_00330 [Deltaproteobacteria bacterium RIFCSPLOWO2_02_FULL_53_8]|nr:MAG: hypothetical protein A3J24_00330 [Deltaproteobacteria bacterium RIFCSPLOWO2_02_FULL_53_8]